MIDTLAEARRKRAALVSRLAAIRANFDREIGLVLTELHAIDRLEVESERTLRDLQPEFYCTGDER